jgi:hypothetical protein
MNNPASMFGHTFLRVDKNREGPEQTLLNYGVNYAANVDTKNVNALAYAFEGLFGFFRGTFTLFPYYAKVQEYSNWESRDLWEYELDFTTIRWSTCYCTCGNWAEITSIITIFRKIVRTISCLSSSGNPICIDGSISVSGGPPRRSRRSQEGLVARRFIVLRS